MERVEIAQCTKCEKMARERDEIEEKFGYKVFGFGKIFIVKSVCKECAKK